ncbi:MFS transporter [Pararhizobium sp. DWP3-4]|uniref:MFS transporter n=1 Tax=Pararhizobium sp. DWP3-4 TaxID=2804565 RepID=UPI003CEAE09F
MRGAMTDTARHGPAGFSGAMTMMFAVAGGLSVANVYYAQPLLGAMAGDFGISPASIGIVVTVTQIGYALGLIFITPLGDILDRRRLIAVQSLLLCLALAAAALAPTGGLFMAAMAAVGLLSVLVQTLIAFAAVLAAPAARGRTVGIVTSGVVIGILCARFIAGLLSDMGGWRSVYLTSAVLTLLMAIALHRILPDHRESQPTPSYWSLLRSIPVLFIEEPVLRRTAGMAFLIFAVFSIFWTSLALPLSVEPHAMSHTAIGLFGLAGVAGALAAGGAGRLADRGLGNWTTGIALGLLLASWALIAMLHTSIPALIAGTVLLDLAIQAVHVTNQSAILAIRPEAKSRIIGGYMVFYSAGSASGAIASTAIYAHAGWAGVCLLGSAVSLAALIYWAVTLPRRENRPLEQCPAG